MQYKCKAFYCSVFISVDEFKLYFLNHIFHLKCIKKTTTVQFHSILSLNQGFVAIDFADENFVRVGDSLVKCNNISSYLNIDESY